MKFITAEEASREWEIGLRTVQRMCASGKIEGAEKISNVWMIPETAKPKSDRKSNCSITKEEIVDAYNAFVSEDYNKFNNFFSKNNLCKSPIIKAYYSAVESYKYFPQIDKMAVYWEKAKEYLNGTDLKIPEISLSMGGHFTLGIFLRTPGDANEISKIISEKLPLFEFITGYKSGLDLLFMAELAFHQGNNTESELLVYKAMFTQDSAPDVKLGIAHILAHNAIYKGDAEGWKRAIEMINKIHIDSEVTKASVEIAKSELFLICDFTERIPEWLKRADFNDSRLTVTSRYNALFVHLSYLVKRKEYARAIAFADVLIEAASGQHYVSYYSFLYLYILMAVCYNKLYMEDKCIDYLKKAIEIAKHDDLLMPFVEYFELLGEASEKYLKENEQDVYNNILKLKMKYSENLVSLKSSLKEPELMEGLTDREKEIANLVAEGRSNAEIAEQLYISKSTVNYHIQNIFSKFGVNRRSMMIKLLFFNDKNDNQ
ncbi:MULTISPECIES: LuxR C-terminal-related transcriptional regulator [unclassified Ruminococcus]|uniref:LuxR C-terminal-related transcriptional regulator n=1 Tax=unclassified Ruminococcus TaxID=2608920 RepID=UPI00210ABDA0|nr:MULTISPECIES: LuxR C-terminal-related transcriptional regulator [unclassified Ruminococcus]MCQ4021702.1 hypothetical protein [Ruminococcus sp. zg-924]MCQ4114147.1 hypothetical protein [Ruminococcus sp. zg-921]